MKALRRLTTIAAPMLLVCAIEPSLGFGTTIVYVTGDDWVVASQDRYSFDPKNGTWKSAVRKVFKFGSAIIGISGPSSFCTPGGGSTVKEVPFASAINCFVLGKEKGACTDIETAGCAGLEKKKYNQSLSPARNAATLVDAIEACAVPCSSDKKPSEIGLASPAAVESDPSSVPLLDIQFGPETHYVFCLFPIVPKAAQKSASERPSCIDSKDAPAAAVFYQGQSFFVRRLIDGVDPRLNPESDESQLSQGVKAVRHAVTSEQVEAAVDDLRLHLRPRTQNLKEEASRFARKMVNLQMELSQSSEVAEDKGTLDGKWLKAWRSKNRVPQDIDTFYLTSRAPGPDLLKADTEPPSIFVTYPKNGQYVQGDLEATAVAIDDTKIIADNDPTLIEGSAVEDRVLLVSPKWNMKERANRTHVLRWTVHDAAGNEGQAVPITVHIDNKTPLPRCQFKNSLPIVDPKEIFPIVVLANIYKAEEVIDATIRIDWEPEESLKLNPESPQVRTLKIGGSSPGEEINWMLQAMKEGSVQVRISLVGPDKNPKMLLSEFLFVRLQR